MHTSHVSSVPRHNEIPDSVRDNIVSPGSKSCEETSEAFSGNPSSRGFHDQVDSGATRVDFINESGEAVDLFWENDDGSLIHYAKLMHGDQWNVDTTVGHRWVGYQSCSESIDASANQTAPVEIGRWIANRSSPLIIIQ